MALSMSGGEATLSLRALVMSDRFDAAWKVLGSYWQSHDDADGCGFRTIPRCIANAHRHEILKV